jgi:hypothetical protein
MQNLLNVAWALPALIQKLNSSKPVLVIFISPGELSLQNRVIPFLFNVALNILIVNLAQRRKELNLI